MRILISLLLLFFSSLAYAQTTPPTFITDEGGARQGPIYTVNCAGAGISCAKSGTIGTLTVAGGGASTLTDLTDVNTTTATRGNLLMADGTDWESITAYGDATIQGSGEIKLQSCSVNEVLKSTGAGWDCGTDNSGGGGTPNILDLGDDGGNDSTDLVEIATSGDTNSIFTEPTADKVLINLANDWPKSDTTDDVTCTNCLSQTEIDFVGTAGTTAGFILVNDGTDYEGVAMSGDATISSAGVVAVVANTIALSDLSDINSTTATAGRLLMADGTDFESVGIISGDVALSPSGQLTINADKVIESMLKAVDTAADEEFLTFETTTGDFEWQAGGGGASTLADLTDVNTTTATSGRILVADGTDWESVQFNDTIPLPVQSAKITGGFVVRTPTGGDASTQGAQIDAGDGNWRLLFDATTDEAAVWQFELPSYWDAHGTIDIDYTMNSATTLEVEFEVDIMCSSDGDSADVGTASFPGVAVGSATVPGTSGYPDTISITPTDDSCAGNDIMWIYLSTDANDATNDDATNDREVIGVTYNFRRR